EKSTVLSVEKTEARISSLQAGRYTWSVRALGAGGEQSDRSPQRTFELAPDALKLEGKGTNWKGPVRLFKSILLLMLVASIIPTAMVGWLSISDTRELLVGDAQELAQERVKQLRMRAENTLEDPLRAVLGLARVPRFFSLPPAEQRTHVATVLNQQREITAITYFGFEPARPPGLQAFATKDMPPTEVAAHEERAGRLLAGLTGIRYSDVYWSPSLRQPALTVAFAVSDPPVAYVAADIALWRLQEVLAGGKFGSNGVAYVADRRGRLIAASPGLGAARTGADLSHRPAVAHVTKTFAQAVDSESFHVGNFGQGSERVVGAYSLMPEVGWAIVSEQPIQLAYKQVAAMQNRIAMALVAAFAVAL